MKILLRNFFLLGFLILISPVFMHAQTIDLGIYSWSAPKSKGALTDSETVKIAIKNYGTEAVSSFTVGFSQDGGNTFKEETVNYTIASNGIYLYTFTSNTAVVGTDGATYEILAKVTIDGDENASNDEYTETVINYVIGDVDDEPFLITSFPYTASGEYVMYTNNYGPNYNISNYMQAEDIVFAFTTTETQMYVDASVTAAYAGSFSPKPGIALSREKPSAFDRTDPDTEAGVGTGSWIASFENAYCYYQQTYYLIIDKGTDYLCTYDLTVNLLRQHDFKFFKFESLSVVGEIDYTNRIVTLTVPQETDVTSLVPTFDLPPYTEVLVNDVTQESSVTSVDFTNDVTYTINQTITPKATQTWTVKVVKSTATAIVNEKLESIQIAPNPANDYIKLINNNFDNIDISILNTSGKIVLQKSNLDKDCTISVSDLQSGIYFIQINSNEGQIIKKFIKK